MTIVTQPMNDTCRWTHEVDFYTDTGYWDTECEDSFLVVEGTPTDENNRMKYCPYCGKPIKVTP